MCKMVYPGIEKIQEKLIFRSLGDQERRQRIGCGFMIKDGLTEDHMDFRFSTYSLVYVIRGRGRYITKEGQEIPLQEGSLFQRHPGIEHSTILDPDSGWRECFLDLGKELYNALVLLRVIIPEDSVYRLASGSGVEKEIYRIMLALEGASERELPHYGMEILQYCTSLLERARQGEDSHWIMVEQSCQDFALYKEQRIDLKEYCRSKGWGYEAFRKIFVNKMGISPGQYIIQRRMDEACRLLRSRKMSVKETAVCLGYKSPYEFSAQFKRITGHSPRDYRDQLLMA